MISVLLVCATVLILMERYGMPLLTRIVGVFEGRLQGTPSSPSPVLPSDLIALAESYGEPWAIEAAKQRMLEDYATLQDWVLVRRAHREMAR